MEQRDLLKDQIEQLGRVLGKILSDFLGLKSKGQAFQGIELSNKQLQNELDINLEKITSLRGKELRNYLENRKLTAEHIETLSEYLMEVAKVIMENKKREAKNKLEKAIELLEIADKTSKTMSFDRMNKKNKIKNMLQQCI